MKKIFLGIISIFMAISLIGCFNKTLVDDSVKDFFKYYSNLDLQKANEYVEDGGMLQKTIKEFEDFNESKKDALKYWSSKISYKLISSETKGKEATVTVDITALNGEDIYSEYKRNVEDLDFNENTLNNDALNGNNIGGDVNRAFITALEDQTIPLQTTKVAIKLKKYEDKWKIENDEEVLKGILGGLNPEVLID